MYLIGHRGARNEAPENTLYGFRYLRNLGINRVEFDVRLNKEKQLYVIHDDSLDRTCDQSGKMKDMDNAALEKVNACHAFNPEIPPEGVPSLDAVLSEWPELLHAQIEVKPPEKDDHALICEGISRCIHEHKIVEQCVITSSDIDFLQSCQQLLPDIKRGYIFYDLEQVPLEVCQQYQCSLLATYWKLCTSELISEAHSNDIEVSAWTVNKRKALEQLTSWGIDSIITDCPSDFREYY